MLLSISNEISKSSKWHTKIGNSGDNVECWTLTSTREFGAANKVQN